MQNSSEEGSRAVRSVSLGKESKKCNLFFTLDKIKKSVVLHLFLPQCRQCLLCKCKERERDGRAPYLACRLVDYFQMHVSD